MRDDMERLRDILEAIDRIQSRCPDDRADFDAGELIQVWVVHHLRIIGEAARGLSEDIRNQNSDVPWKQIIGMRHILVHHYFGIDLDAVWSVVEKDLQPLRESIEKALDAADPQD